MDVQEAAGAIFGAGIASRFTGRSKGRHAAHSGEHHGDCQNCGTPTPGHYCPECGQHAHVHRSVGHVLHELVHGVLHLDGKFWRTLPMMIFRPGRLTRNYIDGKRARYVAPFGMFLFTIFAVYFTFAFVSPDDLFPDDIAEIRASMDADLDTPGQQMTLEDARDQRDALQVEIDQLKKDSETGGISGIGPTVSALVALERTAEAFDTAIAEAETRDIADGETRMVDVEVDAAGMITDIGSVLKQQGDAGGFTVSGGGEDWKWIDEPLQRMFKDPEHAAYRIKQSAYKFSFLLLPLSLPFVWLLFFWRRDIHLYDHTVFILYGLSFASLLGIALWVAGVAGWIAWGLGIPLAILAHQVHMFVQLKGTYRLGLFGALVRTFLLTMAAGIVLLLYSLIVVGLGAFI
ncbi:DUF3667 domain-containing protein [Pacificimonas sp. WHA3]|uniref:DUF3667 domain-containing protein n=1 Tax=Pacificimonas pallii TaxID=2827236 RepID=A0ABS6SA51_9SPHN|nr:DUF3667 domain-containing protein [Pacificimonas pallii]MBV7255260.1 DUF3667 domain-containing protein [Pacificimonas pallii]